MRHPPLHHQPADRCHQPPLTCREPPLAPPETEAPIHETQHGRGVVSETGRSPNRVEQAPHMWADPLGWAEPLGWAGPGWGGRSWEAAERSEATLGCSQGSGKEPETGIAGLTHRRGAVLHWPRGRSHPRLFPRTPFAARRGDRSLYLSEAQLTHLWGVDENTCLPGQREGLDEMQERAVPSSWNERNSP